MGAALRSDPPPMPATSRLVDELRGSGVRPKILTGIERAQPERRDDHELVGEWFRAWCCAQHISVRDLQSLLNVSLGVAAAKWSGERPFSLVDLKRMPARYRMGLTLAYLEWCKQDTSAHG